MNFWKGLWAGMLRVLYAPGVFYKGLFYGPGNRWPDLASHLAGVFGVFLVSAGVYRVFWLDQQPDWAGMSLFMGGISTLLAARVAKYWKSDNERGMVDE